MNAQEELVASTAELSNHYDHSLGLVGVLIPHDPSVDILKRTESTPPTRLRSNEFFKSHAANFVIVLNSVALNIGDNFQKTCEALQILGYQHAALKNRGFQTAYWDIFTDCFEQNRPVTFKKEKEKEAWSRMILFILAQMKIGYQRGLVDRKKSVSVF
ncbi:Globin [Parelaphostrongylus tenuis]|uniref:Globin n=1 Tax=Parelaphostrongylus tenuis TaxID=148309 RepID=A0AAD5WH59_PARTN|nr:Globin [Parelaphostrongylus tenuis]